VTVLPEFLECYLLLYAAYSGQSNEVFTGNQPRQVAVKNRRFESRVDPHHQGSDIRSDSLNSVAAKAIDRIFWVMFPFSNHHPLPVAGSFTVTAWIWNDAIYTADPKQRPNSLPESLSVVSFLSRFYLLVENCWYTVFLQLSNPGSYL
jgi:hypothetical protein